LIHAFATTGVRQRQSEGGRSVADDELRRELHRVQAKVDKLWQRFDEAGVEAAADCVDDAHQALRDAGAS
jgi:hypothetical protein